MNASEFAKQRMQLAGKFKPSDQSPQTAMIVHQYTTLLNSLKRAPGQVSGAGEDTEGPTEVEDPARGAAWEEPSPRETTDAVSRLHAATAAYGPTRQGKNARLWAKSACTVVELGTSQKYVGRSYIINRVTRLQ